MGKKYIMPVLPDEPKKPGFLASREKRERYQWQLDSYDRLRERYQALADLHDEMVKIRSGIDLNSPQDCNALERDQLGNYIIVCPYCLEKYEVGELLYRAETNENANGDLTFCFEPESDDVFAEFWESMGVPNIDPLKGHILEMSPSSGEIRSVTFEINETGAEETVRYNEEVRTRMRKQRVLRMEDKYGVRVSERICPKCHTELPSDIGFWPNYIYSFIGNSYCGKTVYLWRLLLTLTSTRFMNGTFYGVSVNDNETEPGHSAKDKAAKMFSAAGIPLSEATDIGYIRPIILRMQNMETREKFLLTLFDYPGEAIWRDDPFFQHLADRVRLNSNGLIMMFDGGIPLRNMLKETYKSLGDSDAANATAEQVIRRIYGSVFHGNAINKPTALVVSKSDLIDSCLDQIDSWKEKPRILQPPKPHTEVDLCDLYHCHREIQVFLNHYDEGTTETAKMMCNGNHAWFAVSSTGIPLESGVIPEGTKLTGVRESDPLEWLLYRNGHLLADFGSDAEAAPQVMRWAAAFQVQRFAELVELERKWDGDPSHDIPGAYEEYAIEQNRYNEL